MSASKASPSPLMLHPNVLQPKRLNTSFNHVVGGVKIEVDEGEQISKEFVSSGANASANTNVIPPDMNPLPSITPPCGIGLAKLLKLSMLPSGQGQPSPAAATATSGGHRRGVHTMAKRNARERNRVKMVNQGFQTLRQHIPGQFRLKKMSKVDTLRCALDYIRSLSRVLDIPSPEPSSQFADVKSELNSDGDESGLTTCGTSSGSDESGLHCSELSSILSPGSFQVGQQQHRRLDSICNLNNDAAVKHCSIEPESVCVSSHSHHLLFKNKSTHSGSTIHFSNNNGNIVESENKQANGLVLVLPPSSFLDRIRMYGDDDANEVGKENEEYIVGLPRHEGGENFPAQRRSSSYINVGDVSGVNKADGSMNTNSAN